MKKIKIFLIFTAIYAHGVAYAGQASHTASNSPNFAMAIESKLAGISIADTKIYAFTNKTNLLVQIPFNESGKSPETIFGSLTEQKRINLEGSPANTMWRGLFELDNRIAIWDGLNLQITFVNPRNFKVIEISSVPNDTIRPANDSLGPPTNTETQKIRALFRKNALRAKGLKFVGIAKIPNSANYKKTNSYLVATRIEQFPIVLMQCADSQMNACYIDSQCYIESQPKRQTNDIVGIGISSNKKDVLIAYGKQKILDILKFNSCFDLVWRRTVNLPTNSPAISSFTLDHQSRAWITYESTDQFRNANFSQILID